MECCWIQPPFALVFLLFIVVLKIPKEPVWNTSLVLLAGDRLVDCLISKQRGFMVSFWRVASWKGSVEKSTFSFIFRMDLRLQACQLNWGCWARIVFTSSPNLLFSKSLWVFSVWPRESYWHCSASLEVTWFYPSEVSVPMHTALQQTWTMTRHRELHGQGHLLTFSSVSYFVPYIKVLTWLREDKWLHGLHLLARPRAVAVGCWGFHCWWKTEGKKKSFRVWKPRLNRIHMGRKWRTFAKHKWPIVMQSPLYSK